MQINIIIDGRLDRIAAETDLSAAKKKIDGGNRLG